MKLDLRPIVARCLCGAQFAPTITVTATPHGLEVGNLISIEIPRPRWWRLIALYRWWRNPMRGPRTYKVTSAIASTMTVEDVTAEIVRDLLAVKPDATAEEIARVRGDCEGGFVTKRLKASPPTVTRDLFVHVMAQYRDGNVISEPVVMAKAKLLYIGTLDGDEGPVPGEPMYVLGVVAPLRVEPPIDFGSIDMTGISDGKHLPTAQMLATLHGKEVRWGGAKPKKKARRKAK